MNTDNNNFSILCYLVCDDDGAVADELLLLDSDCFDQ